MLENNAHVRSVIDERRIPKYMPSDERNGIHALRTFFKASLCGFAKSVSSWSRTFVTTFKTIKKLRILLLAIQQTKYILQQGGSNKEHNISLAFPFLTKERVKLVIRFVSFKDEGSQPLSYTIVVCCF